MVGAVLPRRGAAALPALGGFEEKPMAVPRSRTKGAASSERPACLRCGAVSALPSHGRPGSGRVWGEAGRPYSLPGIPAGKIEPETKT